MFRAPSRRCPPNLAERVTAVRNPRPKDVRGASGLRGAVRESPIRPHRANDRAIILANSYIPIATIVTPYSGARVVTLHQEVWERHILIQHPDLAGREEWVIQTLTTPTGVCVGTSIHNT